MRLGMDSSFFWHLLIDGKSCLVFSSFVIFVWDTILREEKILDCESTMRMMNVNCFMIVLIIISVYYFSFEGISYAFDLEFLTHSQIDIEAKRSFIDHLPQYGF